jgi:multidrug transporter EmrE-like cation transporter
MSKQIVTMNEPLIAVIAVICNVFAQLSAKHAGPALQLGKGLQSWLSPWLLVAVILYGVAFVLMVRVYAANPLSVASPVMAGGTFLLIALASWLLLGEGLGYQRIAGIGLIFLGIFVLTRS